MNEPITEQGVPGGVTFEALSVEEAIDTGLEQLGLERTEAEVLVLDKGSRGFLGLGAKPARVQVGWSVDAESGLKEAATTLLTLMGLGGEVDVTQCGREVQVTFRTGESDGLLIGRKGETLQAMQHILTRIAGRRFDGRTPEITVDVAGYRERRAEQLRQLALTLAKRVERTGRRAMTEPLPAGERRIVHRLVAELPDVQSHTAGQGSQKRVILTPARGQGPSA